MTATDFETAKDIIDKINVKYIISESSIFNYLKSNNSNNPLEGK
ncbi:MAG: hypothetical protein Fur0015_10340 [Ignavibacteriales bacterium]